MKVVSQIRTEIEEHGVFESLEIAPREFCKIYDLVQLEYAEKLKAMLPQHAGSFLLRDYMQVENQIDHGTAWPKISRCLSREKVDKLCETDTFKNLSNLLGPITISDEEKLGYGNVYFRLVRPNQAADIGPLHADAWFWEIQKLNTKPRVKIWIPLITANQNAFTYIPGSHKSTDYDYVVEERSGGLKPKIVTEARNIPKVNFGSRLGSAIIFHDKLIHGGIGISDHLRVSVEFTILLD